MLALDILNEASPAFDYKAHEYIDQCTSSQLDPIAANLWYLEPSSVAQAEFVAKLVRQLVSFSIGDGVSMRVGIDNVTRVLVINDIAATDGDVDAVARISWLEESDLGSRKECVKGLWSIVRKVGKT